MCRAETISNPFKTDNQRNGEYNYDDMRQSVDICSEMRNQNKNQVVKTTNISTVTVPRPITFTRSMSRESFCDPLKKKSEAWERGGNGDDFKEAFDSLASTKGNELDDGYIGMPDVPRVVRTVLGDDVPNFVLEKFVILCKKAVVGGRVYWADFRYSIYIGPYALTL